MRELDSLRIEVEEKDKEIKQQSLADILEHTGSSISEACHQREEMSEQQDGGRQ